MKFTSTVCLVLLSLGGAAVSAPLEKKQTSAIDVINGAVSDLQATVTSDEGNIASAIAEAKNDVSATAAVEAAINANLQDIAQAFKDAATAIGGATSGAVGGVAGLASSFTQQEINELANDINTAEQTIAGVRATFNLFVTDLTPAVQAAVAAEEQQVVNSVGPFVAPLQALASAVAAAKITGGLNVTGLNGALSTLLNIVSSLLATII